MVVLHDAATVLPLCTPPDLFYKALHSTPRPAVVPGQQRGLAPMPNPPDCVNDTKTGSSSGAWVPLWQRCFPMRHHYFDISTGANYLNPVTGTPVPSGYILIVVRGWAVERRARMPSAVRCLSARASRVLLWLHALLRRLCPDGGCQAPESPCNDGVLG